MATGRSLAETALREPLRIAGWKPRSAGWFTKDMTPGYLGVVALGSASGRAAAGTARVHLHVGVRDETTEQLVARFSEAPDGGYRQRTAITSIGYLMTQKSWREWEIGPDNADEVARELSGAVQEYGQPYVDRLTANPLDLLTEARHHPSMAQSSGTCRIAVLMARFAGADRADAFLREQVESLAERTEPAAQSMRMTANRLLDWLEAR